VTTSENRAAFDRAIERWNAGDLDGYLELYDDGILLHGYSPQPMTKPEVAAMYRGMHQALEGIRIDVDDVVESGDRLCARARMSGVHRGELFGVPGTGTPIEQGVITILRFDNGRCVERWSVADVLGVLVQIGAVPPPG
jgi:predicted ester cyclase